MKIYTKTGDLGHTRLLGGKSVVKSDLRLESYGGVDELNSYLGVTLAQTIPESLKISLLRIQNELFNVGSELACEDPRVLQKLVRISDLEVETLENEIDEMTKTLPELRNFILPGGSAGAAHLHVARTICRRVERITVALAQESRAETEFSVCIKYLNRLSDFLFTAARFCNRELGQVDILWRPS
jgi:cob(I)alamin adenosyltransferase